MATLYGSPAPRTSTCPSWTARQWPRPQGLKPLSPFISTDSVTRQCKAPRPGCTRADPRRSVELASCVQRAVLQATRHSNRGVRRKVLGVVDPANHAQGTAACLAEVSFITTTAEDTRLHDPNYLKALGDSLASGVQEFVGQQIVSVTDDVAVPGSERTIGGAGRAGAFRAPVRFSASNSLSPTASAVTTVRAPLTDVREAIDALPKKGRKTKYAGPVDPGGEPGHSHTSGSAAYKDVLLLTHSDADEESGRILVLDRVGQHKIVTQFRLPTFSPSGPSFFHAGGCQLLGDVLAVPSESGQNASVVAFFDVSDPMQIREFNGALRILRPERDAAAAGITTVSRNGQTVWLLAVYDSGTVDFYESPDFPGGALFELGLRARWRRKTTSTCCCSPISESSVRRRLEPREHLLLR